MKLFNGGQRSVGRVTRVIGHGAVVLAAVVALAAIAGSANATTAYRIIDLGTLDSPNPMSWTYALSESGQVVGQSNGAAPSSSPGFSWTASGGMVNMGTLGSLASAPVAVNDVGQVVGRSPTAAGALHAFSWTRTGGMLDLGTLGGTRSWALDVNNHGVVVGWSEVAGGSQHAFVWTQAHGMVDLGTFGGSVSTAASINDAGQAVGTATTASGSGHPFLWTEEDGMTDLGTLGGANGGATLIDANGHVAGTSDAADGKTHLFWWTPTAGMYDAGTLGGGFVLVSAMNDHDEIVGWGPSSSGPAHGFFWSPTAGMIDLGTLGGVASEAVDVNNAGQVVGIRTTSSSFPPSRNLFSWTPADGMVNLGSLPFIGPNYRPAINDAGQIASTALIGYEVHAVLFVEMTDTTPPVINVPSDMVVSATSSAGAVVTYTVTATDAVDGPVPVGCQPPSGSTFPIGDTTVVCSANDAAGNTGSGSFKVSVLDTTPPVISGLQDMEVDATSSAGAVVTFGPFSATDWNPANPEVTCMPSSGSTFPIDTNGWNQVVCSATDAAGNTQTQNFAIHVRGAQEQITNLIAVVQDYNLGKLGTSLTDKLVTVGRMLNTNRPAQAVQNLDAFISQVKSQAGKGLTAGQANQLTTDANRIKAVIGP